MVQNMRIPMSAPYITEEEISAVGDVLRSGRLSLGPKLSDFEAAFSAYMGTKHAVGVSSGTAGLHLAMIAAGINEGDLVITTPFSFVASANVILYEGGIPIFVDVDPETGNIDPALVAAAAEDLRSGAPQARHWLPPSLRDASTHYRRLKAVLPVHVFGQPVNMDPILETARQYDLRVVEDACEAIGAEYKGNKVGSLGDVAVFAFYPNKQMTTGEGGMIVTDRSDWAALFRSLLNQGRDIFSAWLEHDRLGYNYRLDEMSAVLGLGQLSRIDDLIRRRARVAEWYNERLGHIAGVASWPVVETTTHMSWFVYVVRITNGVDRATVMASLEKAGIPSRPYFNPIHVQPFYRQRFGFQVGDFPRTEALARSSLALPFSSIMTEEQVDEVCDGLAKAMRSLVK